MYLHHSFRRERTVTTTVMAILTAVMFVISATYFALDVFLVSNGLLHPDKYPRSVVDRYGPAATAQIICLGINVRHSLFEVYSTWTKT
jgi:hypothetical protein